MGFTRRSRTKKQLKMPQKVKITLRKELMYGRYHILFYFPYNAAVYNRLNRTKTISYNPEVNCWIQSSIYFRLHKLLALLDDVAEIDSSNLGNLIYAKSDTLVHNREKFEVTLPESFKKKLLQKRYSENTIKTYCHYFKQFQIAFRHFELNSVTTENINEYIFNLVSYGRISYSQQNQRINAIKFYYEKVLGQEKYRIHIDRPRSEKRLPDVLSKQDVVALLKATKNLKHYSMLSLIYSAGLRRSELLALEVTDIDSVRGLIKIRGSKGKKDRYSIISQALIKKLREYYKEFKPKLWLFEGVDGKQYSSTSLHKVLKKSVQLANIKKRVHLHMLRHSFATHLLDKGTSIRLIQNLLGHDSIKTTEIYTHVTNSDLSQIRNPLDDLLDFEEEN